MNNQEAIAIGTDRFLENNRDLVLKAIEKAVNNSIPEIAAAVGIQMSARLHKFLNDNRADFINVGKEMLTREILSNLEKRVEFDRQPAFQLPKEEDKPKS